MSRSHSNGIKGGLLWEIGQSFPFLPLPLPFPIFLYPTLTISPTHFFFSLPLYFLFFSIHLPLTLSCSLYCPPPYKSVLWRISGPGMLRNASLGAPNLACKVDCVIHPRVGMLMLTEETRLGAHRRELVCHTSGGNGVMVAFKPSDETFGVVETPILLYSHDRINTIYF